PTVSCPSMRIDPASGRSRPRMHLISTDLPVPEPPMMTRLSPAAQSMSMPSRTIFGPNDFLTPRTEILGAVPWLMWPLGSFGEEYCRQHIVEQQDQDRGRHHRIGRRLADPGGAAARRIAVIAAHQGHDEAEHRRPDQAGDDIHRV